MATTSEMDCYEPIERASVDELRSLQLARLREIVAYAYANVEHYRRSFDAAGAAPGDLAGFEDLARFPLLAKADLRDNYPFGMFAVPRSEVVRVHASSGTTGKPTVVGYTTEDIDVWAQLMARSIYAAGGRPGDVAHVAYGYGLFTGGLGAHYGAERLGCTVVPVSGGQTERQVTLIADFEPRIILVTPSYCLNLIDEMEQRGIDPVSCSLKVGIFGAEPWTDELRAEIEGRLGMDAVDIYGLSEVMGPGVAQECVDTKDGPTLWEDHFYPEIIDPDTGEVLGEGAFGELVLTALTKRGQPVIRYRTRDLTRLLPGTARTMRRIQRVTGRSDDMLIVRGVNVFPSQIEAEILKVDGLTPHFQIHVDRSANLASLTIRVERDPASRRAADELGTALADHIKGNIGVSAEVAVAEPGEVPRSAGKAQRVVPAG
ncbi:MAG: phenylacetate--CoA ligase [Acidimicrobiaceae bacterium]|nr:phenylacetate--CoA ligase [Acidimicrobiaceae bacterium]MXW88752.1 phenylacetate--CoA ligase [Acidimicrobiaceae bacterium]MYE56928.1 phenylacetate--CoA ligase [Acidimicrobiaceae bacterium]MYI14521.1 phenylacetate--CoA ligase [Acidimicrobiaceae bacterium]